MNTEDRKSEHYLLFLVGAMVFGIAGFLNPNRFATNSLRDLGMTAATYWFLGLIVGSLTCLVGLIRPTVLGRGIERAGLLLLSGLMLGFASAVFWNSGPRGLGFAVFVGAFGIANLIRLLRLGREVRGLRSSIVRIHQSR
jgi:hypothetical protein